MKLNKTPFDAISNGKQRYEVRLNDEKRQSVKVGDTIVFSKLPELNDKITTKVLEIITADNFSTLFTLFPIKYWGNDMTTGQCSQIMKKFYSELEINKYGVVAFKIELE
jgi:ASC-1-like (ASCH) protein